jgi:hypothetical protein
MDVTVVDRSPRLGQDGGELLPSKGVTIISRSISIGPFNSEVQRIGLLSYARIFFI